MADEQVRTLQVKSTDPTRCGVWDRHPDHPAQEGQVEGEVYVAGETVVEVAATPLVLDALAKGRIREVSGAEVPARQPSRGPAAQSNLGGLPPADRTVGGEGAAGSDAPPPLPPGKSK
jgi:hypothetical protein